LIDIDIDISNF